MSRQKNLPAASCIGCGEEGFLSMDTIDQNMEQRVWSRVMGTQSACTRAAQRDAAVLDERALRELHSAQQLAACTYRALAAQLRGSRRQTLLSLAASKAAQAKTLAAMFFVMSGQRLCPQNVQTPQHACLSQTLRQAYREELCTAELYRRYAANAPDFSAALSSLAACSCRDTQRLLGVLQSCL